MQFQGDFFTSIVLIMAVAFGGALVARLLRAPPLFGYLAAGMIIGPFGAQLIDSSDEVSTLAEFGVVLLLFGVGIEVSFRDIQKMRNVVVAGGLAQIMLTGTIGFLVGRGLGWDVGQATVFGMVIALSSTMVALKVLSDRGELRSLHGRVLTGLLVVQDLAFIPMIAILPAMSGNEFSVAELALGLLKAAVVLSLLGVMGTRIVPWVLRRVAGMGSREVFLLTLVAITFGAALLTKEVGLSAALGAFVAGLVLSESDYGHRALSEILPLRDMFSALFFVSLGMLADPGYLADHPGLVAVVVGTVVVVKLVFTAGIVRGFRYLPHTSLLVALGTVQIGEFSFILAGAAVNERIVGQDFFTMVVVSAVVTMALTPPVYAGGSALLERLARRVRALRPYRPGDKEHSEERGLRLRDHVVIVGMGRIGTLVAQSLQEHKIPFVSIDLDPGAVARARAKGQHALYGSSTNGEVLKAARIRQARTMALVTGDPATAYVTVERARELNPELDIVARVHWREEGERLQRMGVREVVWPEMEAGLEILRHTMHAHHARRSEVDALVARLRESLAIGGTPETAYPLPPPEGLGPPEKPQAG